jgi:hypothetical protein
VAATMFRHPTPVARWWACMAEKSKGVSERKGRAPAAKAGKRATAAANEGSVFTMPAEALAGMAKTGMGDKSRGVSRRKLTAISALESKRETVSDAPTAYTTPVAALEELAKIGIDDTALAPVIKACRDLGLPLEAYVVLVWGTVELADLTKNVRVYLQPDRVRLASLDAVIRAADGLRLALGALSTSDAMGFGNHFTVADLGVRFRAFEPCGPHEVLTKQCRFVEEIAARTSKAASDLRKQRVEMGLDTKVKRLRTVQAYAGIVATISYGLAPYGVEAKRSAGGPLRKLCDAVFSAARVPSTSAGPLAHFLDELLPSMREHGGPWAAFKARNGP